MIYKALWVSPSTHNKIKVGAAGLNLPIGEFLDGLFDKNENTKKVLESNQLEGAVSVSANSI